MTINSEFTDTLHQGWLSLGTNSLISRHRQLNIGDKGPGPSYSISSLTPFPTMAPKRPAVTAAQKTCSWLSMPNPYPTPRLHGNQVPCWPFIFSLRKAKVKPPSHPSLLLVSAQVREQDPSIHSSTPPSSAQAGPETDRGTAGNHPA